MSEQIPQVGGHLGDTFILGCGRSGTSAVAGLFAKAGVYVGDRLLDANDMNPLGYFQDSRVIQINESILKECIPLAPANIGRRYAWDIPRRGQLWLTRLPLGTSLIASADQVAAIRKLTTTKPFCLKDPRFTYTLDVWTPHAVDPRVICVFRNPAAFVQSVFRLCLRLPEYHDFAVSVTQLFEVWLNAYSFMLHSYDVSRWLFVEFEGLFEDRGFRRLEDFVRRPLDRNAIMPDLNRSDASLPVPDLVGKMHSRLRDLSAVLV